MSNEMLSLSHIKSFYSFHASEPDVDVACWDEEKERKSLKWRVMREGNQL